MPMPKEISKLTNFLWSGTTTYLLSPEMIPIYLAGFCLWYKRDELFLADDNKTRVSLLTVLAKNNKFLGGAVSAIVVNCVAALWARGQESRAAERQEFAAILGRKMTDLHNTFEEGLAYLAEGKFKQAQSNLSLALGMLLELRPDPMTALWEHQRLICVNKLAVCAFHLGELSSANQLLSQELDCNAHEMDRAIRIQFLNLRAFVHLRQKQFELAQKDVVSSLQLNPTQAAMGLLRLYLEQRFSLLNDQLELSNARDGTLERGGFLEDADDYMLVDLAACCAESLHKLAKSTNDLCLRKSCWQKANLYYEMALHYAPSQRAVYDLEKLAELYKELVRMCEHIRRCMHLKPTDKTLALVKSAIRTQEAYTQTELFQPLGNLPEVLKQSPLHEVQLLHFQLDEAGRRSCEFFTVHAEPLRALMDFYSKKQRAALAVADACKGNIILGVELSVQKATYAVAVQTFVSIIDEPPVPQSPMPEPAADTVPAAPPVVARGVVDAAGAVADAPSGIADASQPVADAGAGVSANADADLEQSGYQIVGP